MRELHVVALSEDGRHVVLATRAGTASGEFRVALDERLTAAVRGELPAPGRDAPPSISPREIQARLRDGQTPEQIAASAGVPLSRVERYAGPVLAELERVITGARAATVTRPRLGASALPLGEAVEAHLSEVAHLAEGSVRWSARRTDLGRWVVEVSWTARGRRRSAGWHYDPTTREVSAVDGPSAVLGHVEAEAAVAAASRPARPAPGAVRGAGRNPSAPGGGRSSAGASDAGGRPARSPVTPAAGSPTAAAAAGSSPGAARPASPAASTAASTAARAGATARASSPRPSSPRSTQTAAAPPPAPAPPSRRRAAAAPAPAAAAAPSRRRQPLPPAPGAVAAAPTPAAKTSTRGAPARGGSPDTSRGSAATGRPQPRRAPARRSPVPPLDELAAPSAGATVPSTAPSAARATPTPGTRTPGSSTPDTPAPDTATPRTAAPVRAPVPGPPVLRVVPPADPEPAQDAQDDTPPAQARPARRAAGQRAGGRDWADVLMGGAPVPPAAQPRQD